MLLRQVPYRKETAAYRNDHVREALRS